MICALDSGLLPESPAGVIPHHDLGGNRGSLSFSVLRTTATYSM